MIARFPLLVSVPLAFLGSSPAAEPGALEKAIRPLAEAHKGKIAVAVKNLATGEHCEMDADAVMPTASLIKLAVLVEAYRQADAKALDLDGKVTLAKGDKVPGSGILTQHFSDGATFPLRDAVRLMIAFSDNTATNLVLDAVGIAGVNAAMRKLGMPETRINAKVFKGSTTSVDPERTKKYSLGSTTAGETIELLAQIHAGKAASAGACREMLGHLRAGGDRDTLLRYLPAGTVVAHKTGSTDRVRTAAGIIEVPDPKGGKTKIPIALCVLTNENADGRWVLDNAGLGDGVNPGDVAEAGYPVRGQVIITHRPRRGNSGGRAGASDLPMASRCEIGLRRATPPEGRVLIPQAHRPSTAPCRRLPVRPPLPPGRPRCTRGGRMVLSPGGVPAARPCPPGRPVPPCAPILLGDRTCSSHSPRRRSSPLAPSS